MAAHSQISSPRQNGTFENENYHQSMVFKGCSSIRDYELMGKLGEGTFGEVHRARSKKTGAIVALKKILMHNEKDGFPITALREIKLLKLLNHPNVLRLEEMAVEHAQKTGDKKRRSIMYMVTPYMDHDLSGLLENPSVKFTEPQIKCYLLQLLQGLKYLHGESILHRDMKAANLLINNKGILQIADFGLARHYNEPVPVAGRGGGSATRDYTTLVVTRWYRPPELLMQLRKYTTAIDLWGVGCVFGEMLNGRPILAGDSDLNQLKMIFDLVGTPNDQTMPGFRDLSGAQGLQEWGQRAPTLNQRFREHGSGAISLLNELLKLDWRKRINAIDALNHPYFRNEPLPARPGDIPVFEESHELDRRKFRKERAGPPPAPKGGTVGMGAPGEEWQSGGQGFSQSQRYEAANNRVPRRPNNQNAHPPRSQGNYHSGNIPPPGQSHHSQPRRPAWERNGSGPDTRLPPRPPPPYAAGRKPLPSDELNYSMTDGNRSDHTDHDRDRGIPPPPRSNPGGSRPPANIDTYIPNYGSDNRAVGRDRGDRDRDRDFRRDSYERDERGYPPVRDRRTRTRSRSPVRERGPGVRDHREREPLSRERDSWDRDTYRR